MSETTMRVFDRIAQAQAARLALIEAGFGPDEIELASTEDEAGPCEGNFVLSSEDDGKAPAKARRSPEGGRQSDSGATRSGSFVLAVTAADSTQAARAAELLDRMGAIDPEALCGRTSLADRPGDSVGRVR